MCKYKIEDRRLITCLPEVAKYMFIINIHLCIFRAAIFGCMNHFCSIKEVVTVSSWFHQRVSKYYKPFIFFYNSAESNSQTFNYSTFFIIRLQIEIDIGSQSVSLIYVILTFQNIQM